MCYRNALSNKTIKVLSVAGGGPLGAAAPSRTGPPARERSDAEALAAPREVPKST